MPNVHHNNLFFGLSGIVLPVPKYQFPPDYQNASRLTYYATFFNSIEINSSFYKIPLQKTVARWAASVPDQFRFTFKLFREVTHVKNLDFDPEHVVRFMDAISSVGTKSGCILVQFPPGLSSANITQLNELLKIIKGRDPDNHWHVAVEFRNRGWYQDEVYELLEHRQCGLVFQDKPSCATPLVNIETDFVYMRFHGPTGNYRGSYSEEELKDHAARVLESSSEQKKVFIYFNNTAGDAFENLRTLEQFARGG